MQLTKAEQQRKLFHTLDDVFIPKTGEFGYIFGYAVDVNMYLVKEHDGTASDWYHAEDIQHLCQDHTVDIRSSECR